MATRITVSMCVVSENSSDRAAAAVNDIKYGTESVHAERRTSGARVKSRKRSYGDRVSSGDSLRLTVVHKGTKSTSHPLSNERLLYLTSGQLSTDVTLTRFNEAVLSYTTPLRPRRWPTCLFASFCSNSRYTSPTPDCLQIEPMGTRITSSEGF